MLVGFAQVHFAQNVNKCGKVVKSSAKSADCKIHSQTFNSVSCIVMVSLSLERTTAILIGNQFTMLYVSEVNNIPFRFLSNLTLYSNFFCALSLSLCSQSNVQYFSDKMTNYSSSNSDINQKFTNPLDHIMLLDDGRFQCIMHSQKINMSLGVFWTLLLFE